MSGWTEAMTELLGKRVEVTISTQPEPVTVTGVLEDFDPFGGVTVRSDSGELHQAWPNLHIRELTR